jgi:hypothetical protein
VAINKPFEVFCEMIAGPITRAFCPHLQPGKAGLRLRPSCPSPCGRAATPVFDRRFALPSPIKHKASEWRATPRETREAVAKCVTPKADGKTQDRSSR